MSQKLQNFVKFQKFQLENLVDFEKCCKTHIFLQKSEPIQPKTSNILPKFCQPTLFDGAKGPMRAGLRRPRHDARDPRLRGAPGRLRELPAQHPRRLRSALQMLKKVYMYILNRTYVEMRQIFSDNIEKSVVITQKSASVKPRTSPSNVTGEERFQSAVALLRSRSQKCGPWLRPGLRVH